MFGADEEEEVVLTPEQHRERVQTALMAGVIGALVATLVGRSRTRIDNLMIGGLFTGFAAYRDPRASFAATLAVAGVEGAIWGITDQFVPKLKDYLMPPPALQKGLVPAEHGQTEPAYIGV